VSLLAPAEEDEDEIKDQEEEDDADEAPDMTIEGSKTKSKNR